MDPRDDQGRRQPPSQEQPGSRNLAPTVSGHDWVDTDVQSTAATVGDNRAVSPLSLQLDNEPSTPAAVSEIGGGEYFETEPFPTISNVPALTNQSTRSASHGPAPGPNRAPSTSNPPPPPSSLLGPERPTSRIPRQPSVPSIRIRRRGTSTGSNRPGSSGSSNVPVGHPGASRTTSTLSDSNRPRSISQPERSYIPGDVPNVARHSRRAAPQAAMPRLTEEGGRPSMHELGINEPLSPTQSLPEESMGHQAAPGGAYGNGRGVRRKVSKFLWPGRGKQEQEQGSQMSVEEAERAAAYDDALVDYLDTIDPEVQTLSTLTNVQNSLFVPNVGHWLNRRPTYNLSQHDPEIGQTRPLLPGRMGTVGERQEAEAEAEAADEQEDRPAMGRSNTISSRLTESHYAALPHGASLEGWTAEEKQELDDHVRHMLHSRRSKFKRRMKGFGQYLRRPLGFLVTLYATLITLFGLAWVLFLIGWIYVGEKQVYVIHIIDSVLVALFLVMGGGLAPFRVVDTYHTGFILYYAHLVKNAGKPKRNRLRKKQLPPDVEQSIRVNSAAQGGEPGESLVRTTHETEPPQREDGDGDGDGDSNASNDPHTMRNNIVDVDDAKSGILAYENTPLTPEQQERLHHHQMKLAKSHTYYKPHETFTHYAFPLNYLIAIIILCDAHSCLQIALSSTTWGIDYRTRPFALTTVILCVSITCNITAGVIISIGDRKTRKKDVFSLLNRQELTGDAIKEMEEKRNKDSKSKSGAETESERDSRSSKVLSKPATENSNTLAEAKS